MKIAVAGTGYVGLSLAVLLSQYNEVHALDIVPEKVEKINNYQSPIQDDEIERFLAEAKAGERELDLHATVDVAEAYTDADYAVIATPTNYDSDRNFFDTSSGMPLEPSAFTRSSSEGSAPWASRPANFSAAATASGSSFGAPTTMRLGYRLS